jgi:hypothetical protein
VLCPIKSSKCLAFLNPGGRRGDLISEILGPSPVLVASPTARGTGASSTPSSYASFLITPLYLLPPDPFPLASLVPPVRRKYGASFSKYQQAPSEFLCRVIGTPRRRECRVGASPVSLEARSFPTFSILPALSRIARNSAPDNVKGRPRWNGLSMCRVAEFFSRKKIREVIA